MSHGQSRSDSDASPLNEQLEQASGRVIESALADRRIGRIGPRSLPEGRIVAELVDQLYWLLFPGFEGPRDLTETDLADHLRSLIIRVGTLLYGQVVAALHGDVAQERQADAVDLERRAARTVGSLMASMPQIRAALSLDVQAALDGDPAARSIDEIVLCYPGVRALAVHRVAHELHKLGIPLIPRMLSERAHSASGIDIHPGARIGRSFFIDHGTGVVIGETTVIGDHCKIYQGVTLGAKQFEKDEQGQLRRDTKRHPTLEDHVTVYAGATILGGRTVIGAGSVVNGGVFVTSSVPPGHVVRGPKLDITLRSNPQLPPTNYSI